MLRILSDLCPNYIINLDELDDYSSSAIIQVMPNKITYHRMFCKKCACFCDLEFIKFKFMKFSYFYPITTRVLIFNKHKMFNMFNIMIADDVTFNNIDVLSHLDISSLPSRIDYKQELEMFIKLNL